MIDPQRAGSAQALHEQAPVIAALHFKIGDRLDQVGEAREAIVARSKARHRFSALAELRERRIAFFIALRRLVGRAEDLEEFGINRALALGKGGLLELLRVVERESADVEEPGAGLLEGEGRLRRPEAVDRQPVLADSLGEGKEVAVRRHDPEAVDIAAVE